MDSMELIRCRETKEIDYAIAEMLGLNSIGQIETRFVRRFFEY
jgi:hypothetical protein